MENTVNIRVMVIDDYGKACELWKAAPGIGLRPLDDSERGLKKFLRRNPHTSFVAEQDGELAGLILGGHDGRRGYIYHAVVKEGLRGQGIGKALTGAVESAMIREGINKIGLMAFKANIGANRFWKALGYPVREDLAYRDKSLNPENKGDRIAPGNSHFTASRMNTVNKHKETR
jgi:ribosomal protein S18 acetylase RimI-like enzyme